MGNGTDAGGQVLVGQKAATSAMKNSDRKSPISLVPYSFIWETGMALREGSLKYQPWDWMKARPWSEYYDATLRHVFAAASGEDYDPDAATKVLHLAEAAANIAFLIEFHHGQRGEDNRPQGLYIPRHVAL